MNRILIYLDAAVAHQKEKVRRIRERCETVSQATEELVDFWCDDEGAVRFILNSDVFGRTTSDTTSLGTDVALALREFGALCMATAERLEGGAV